MTFDYSFLKQWAVNHKRTLSLNAYDTLKIARKCLPAEQSKKLEDLCEYFGVSRENAHRALDDAIETKQIFEKLLVLMDEKGETVEMCIRDRVYIVGAILFWAAGIDVIVRLVSAK